jgi:signal transduction histidine kinase
MTNTILQRQTRVRREIARRFQSDLFNASQLREHVMHETHGHVKATEGSAAFGTPRMPTRPMTWSMTAKAKPHKPSEFESVLLAIAGHDLRQPLQVIQNVHDILGRGLRTTSELRLLQYGQSAVERLRDQLDELLAALRLCESGKKGGANVGAGRAFVAASYLREQSRSSNKGSQRSYGPD